MLSKLVRIGLVLLLFVFLFFMIFLIGYFVGMPDKPTLSRLFPQRKPFTLTESRINPQIQKKEIISTSGGTISVVDEKGLRINLIIPPGAVEKETEVTVSSLPAIPIDGYHENEQTPGILIEPIDIAFIVPARLVFEYIPIGASEENAPANVSSSDSEEIGKRTNTSVSSGRQTTGTIIHTNSSKDQSGNRVNVSPVSSGQTGSEINTNVNEGGSYNYQDSVSAKDARDHIENVLNDPNATPEQILEAASLAQAWGFEDLDENAKGKLKEKIKDVAEKLKEVCASGSMPVSKQILLQWQTLSQALGFDDLANSFEERQKDCHHPYRFTFKYNGEGVNGVYTTYFFKGSMCDDTWEGQYSGEISGVSTGYFKSPMLHFSLLPNLPTSVSFTIVEGIICGGGNCVSMAHPYINILTLLWDGANIVRILDGYLSNQLATFEIDNTIECPLP